MKYSEFFDVLRCSSEINPDSVGRENWQETYPHSTFIDLLQKAGNMLSREDKQRNKPLWIHGAYGTGKSRIAWTLEKLLTCSVQELNQYFDEYDVLKEQKDLRNKLIGQKQSGKIVVATRYASADIDGIDSLISAVYQSLSIALDRAGFTYDASKTVKGGIIKWLEEKDSHKGMFNSAIHDGVYQYDGSFANKTADNILAELKSGKDVTSLLKSIAVLSKKEGLTCLSFSIEDLKAWIREVIETHHLKALVLIWDEFSAFFKNNKTRLDSLQSLVELSNDVPFDFIIVTHVTNSIIADGDLAASTIKDRFQTQEITMPESIAFQLIGHSLKIRNSHQEDWDEFADDLNSRLDNVRKQVATYLINMGVKKDDFKKMLPFHPYAALALKNIANLFDSNQRSMFNFIADKSKDLKAFHWYIEQYGPEDDDPLLTVDMLWDYFYLTGHGVGGSGRNNLNQMICSILDYYPMKEKGLTGVEKRVLKTVLIFQALAKKLGNDDAFLATEKNLHLAFDGNRELERGAGFGIVDSLVKRKILFEDEIKGQKVFHAPMAMQGSDVAEIEKLKAEKLLQTKTKDLLQDNSAASVFAPCALLNLPPALKTRFIVEKTGLENFDKTMNSLIAQDSLGYKMKALMVFSHTENNVQAIHEKIAIAVKNIRANGIVFIDATSTCLSQEEFERWAENSAKASFYLAKDKQQSNLAGRDASSVLQTWADNISSGTFKLFSDKIPDGTGLVKKEKVCQDLENIVKEKYPQSLEFVNSLTEPLFKPSANQTMALAGIYGSKAKLPQKGSCAIDTNQEKNLLEDAQFMDSYWTKLKDLNISKLKQKVDSQIQKAFAPGSAGRISVRDIVDELFKRGFMPTQLHCFLTGFLLKEYANAKYRYSDDAGAGGQLDPIKLAEMICAYFKFLCNQGGPKYHDWYIEVLTEEQRHFVELADAVFHVGQEASIEQLATRISSKVNELQYPLWCFTKLTEVQGLEPFIDKFTVLLNPVYAQTSSGAIASEIGKLTKDMPEAQGRLVQLITKENAQRAMEVWLSEFEDFTTVVEDIKPEDYLADIRHCFSANGTWLWNKETGTEEIRKVLRDYKIIQASIQGGFISSVNSIPDCFAAWKDKASALKIPKNTLESYSPKMKGFLSLLGDIANGHNLEQSERRDKFLNEITTNKDMISDFFKNRQDNFKIIYKVDLTGLSDDEIKSLFASLDSSSFLKDKAEYEGLLKQKIEDLQRSQTRTKLLALWKEKTGTTSPSDWSNQHKIPILYMIPSEHYNEIAEVFSTINNNNPQLRMVENALDYLQKHEETFQYISANVDSVFKERILGKYSIVLRNLDKVREQLQRQCGADVYKWYGQPNLNSIIMRLAEQEYNLSFSKQVREKIDDMSAENAKSYLKQLVCNKLDVGIQILQEQDD